MNTTSEEFEKQMHEARLKEARGKAEKAWEEARHEKARREKTETETRSVAHGMWDNHAKTLFTAVGGFVLGATALYIKTREK